MQIVIFFFVLREKFRVEYLTQHIVDDENEKNENFENDDEKFEKKKIFDNRIDSHDFANANDDELETFLQTINNVLNINESSNLIARDAQQSSKLISKFEFESFVKINVDRVDVARAHEITLTTKKVYKRDEKNMSRTFMTTRMS